MSETPVASYEADLAGAFPAVDPGAAPLGARVLIQLRMAKKKVTASGIILAQETRDTEKAQNPVGKVVGIGPLAFKSATRWSRGPRGRGVRLEITSACRNGRAIDGKSCFQTLQKVRIRWNLSSSTTTKSLPKSPATHWK